MDLVGVLALAAHVLKLVGRVGRIFRNRWEGSLVLDCKQTGAFYPQEVKQARLYEALRRGQEREGLLVQDYKMGCCSRYSSLSLLGVPIIRNLCAVCHECDHQAQVTVLELVHLRG